MRSLITRAPRAAVLAAALMLATACVPNSSNDDRAQVIPGVPSGTVAIRPERLEPFCQAMIGLSETLETDPPADVNALVIEIYTDIADDVPPEISGEFTAVLALLQGKPVPVTQPEVTELTATQQVATAETSTPGDGTGPDGSAVPVDDVFFNEGYLPGDDPTERLNAYVNFVCRDSQNNPGPPATQPHDGIAPSTDDS